MSTKIRTLNYPYFQKFKTKLLQKKKLIKQMDTEYIGRHFESGVCREMPLLHLRLLLPEDSKIPKFKCTNITKHHKTRTKLH